MRNNLNETPKYSNYNNGPLSLEEVYDIYVDEKLNFTRVDLYRDFTNSLTNKIFETYLGHYDVVCDNMDKVQHFGWCWDNTIDTYFKLGYDLTDVDGEKYKYFLKFFISVYYNVDSTDIDTLEQDILVVWEYIFNYLIIKPHKDVYNFVGIVKMFDNTNWFKN